MEIFRVETAMAYSLLKMNCCGDLLAPNDTILRISRRWIRIPAVTFFSGGIENEDLLATENGLAKGNND